MIETGNPDVIIITETWLTPDVTDNEVNLPNFEVHRVDRLNRKGGGVVIYLKKGLTVRSIEALAHESESCELLRCRLKCIGQDIDLIAVYRSPDCSADDFLIEKLGSWTSKCRSLVVGDFNAPTVDWSSLTTPSSVNSFDHKLLESSISLALVQHIIKPTRYDSQHSSSTLDLVFSHGEDVDLIQHLPPLGRSDHAVLTFKFTATAARAKTPARPNVWKADINAIVSAANSVNWYINPESQVEAAWNQFKQLYAQVTVPFIPWSVPKGRKHSPPWINREIRKLLRRKRKCWNLFATLETSETRELYTTARNKAIAEIRQSRMKFETHLAQNAKAQPKKIFSYLNFRNKTPNGVPNLIIDKDTIEEDQEKAEAMANYFSQVFTQESSLPIGSALAASEEHGIDSVDIDQGIVLNFLMKLDAGKSMGPDSLHPRLLKELSAHIAGPLTTIFKLSLQNGVLPRDWKDAIVTPIHKGGSRQSPSNYRPISLTSTLIKTLERIIKKSIMAYLENSSLLSGAQHGFRRNLSCLSNLLTARESWVKSKDDRRPVDVVFIDFSKAFDKVPHKRLLMKLESLGIKGRLLDWLREFLIDRRQRVRINSKLSSWTAVSSGVPQGTVLGPLLFILYINELPLLTDSPMVLYADDLKIWRELKGNSDTSTLQDDLNKLSEWSVEWMLPINVAKCATMRIGQASTSSYELEGITLPSVQTHLDLGVIVSHDLKTTAHCRAVAARSFRSLWAIRRAFTRITRDMFTSLYTSLVRSRLENCIQAASPCLKGDSHILESVQRKATRMVHGIANLSYEERLDSLNLFSLSYRRQRGDLITMFKILNNDYGPDLFSLFLPTRSEHLRGHSRRVQKPRRNHIAVEYWFSHRVINSWNRLPEEVVSATSIDSFKKGLDNHRNLLEKD
uniref:Reverse transcriptase domain-containing protein n=2 Tax=Trichobilharzia regenti TaxID=157069 RepID=A0AA85KFH1_TRIRE|nr:unnamed protein product [Trichobilharzia regenti]